MDRETRVIFLLVMLGALIYNLFTAGDPVTKEFLAQTLIIAGFSAFYLVIEAIESGKNLNAYILWRLTVLIVAGLLAFVCFAALVFVVIVGLDSLFYFLRH